MNGPSRGAVLPWLVVAALAGAADAGAPAARGQAPATTAPAAASSATPTGTAYPPPDLAGLWSVTRSWRRQCPGCSATVVRTTSWVITQQGDHVRVQSGLAGQVAGAAAGGGWLTLDGLESAADGVYRFWYGSLAVAPDAASFEGRFAGSEQVDNPCGPEPPLTTCFVGAGHLRAQRVATPATPGTPGASVPAPASQTSVQPTPQPDTATAGPTSPSRTATPAVGTATGTPVPPPRPLLLPVACR